MTCAPSGELVRSCPERHFQVAEHWRDTEEDGSMRPQGSLQSAELRRKKSTFPYCLHDYLFSGGDKAYVWSLTEKYFSSLFHFQPLAKHDQTRTSRWVDRPPRAHLYSLAWTKYFHTDAFS